MYGIKTSIVALSLFFGATSASFSGPATFFAASSSPGDCGNVYGNSDFVVALNAAQFSQASCGQTIQITYNGISANAVIEDMCPSCSTNGLDLTEGLFQHFASLSTGLIEVTWDFV